MNTIDSKTGEDLLQSLEIIFKSGNKNLKKMDWHLTLQILISLWNRKLTKFDQHSEYIEAINTNIL